MRDVDGGRRIYEIESFFFLLFFLFSAARLLGFGSLKFLWERFFLGIYKRREH